MPDVQEVFGMATQKVRPDPGAMERQSRNQRRRVWNPRVGGYVVLAVLVVAGLAIGITALRDGEDPGARPGDGGSTVVDLTDPEDLPEPTMDLTAAVELVNDQARGFSDLRHRVDVQGVGGVRLVASGNAGASNPTAWYQPALLVGRPGQTLTLSLSNPDLLPHTFTLPDQDIDVHLSPRTEDQAIVRVTFPAGDEPILFFCRYHQLYGQTGALVAST